MADGNGVISQMISQSAQSRFAKAPETSPGLANVLVGLIRAGEMLPAWWSRQRDISLFRMFLQSDAFQGAVYKVVSKMVSIQPKVMPRDANIKASIRLADEYNTILYENWELGQGWQAGFKKDLEDYLTQDNGFFREITGDGPKDGPIVGPPSGTISLDSQRCTRTNNPIFPVVYTDTDGQKYKYHHSRVMFAAQAPSTRATMNGVGRCWITRAVNVAQNLMDILIYKQEKLGSRPLRQILVGKGITAEQIWGAIVEAEESMDNQGLRRYSKTIAIGSQSTDVDLNRIDMASLPDGFDERTSTELGMFAIALAAGIPPRDLWPASTPGATRADADIQHVAGSAGYQNILDTFAFLIGGSPLGGRQQIRGKFLPASLKLVFDFVDDEQDSRKAQNAATRAQTRERDLADGLINIRVARLQALEAGDLDQPEFEELELGDGRLPDGTSVINLFLSTDPEMQALLDISTPNPLDTDANLENVEFILERIKEANLLATVQAVNATTTRLKQQGRQAVRALTELDKIYREAAGMTDDRPEDEEETAPAADDAGRPAREAEDERDADPINEAAESDQEEKEANLSDQQIIHFAPLDAQAANYRRATKADMGLGARCSTCVFNERGTICALFNFNFVPGFVCDRWQSRTVNRFGLAR